MLETLNHLDQQLLLALNALHAPFWDSFMWYVSAKWTWVPMYATILYILLRNGNWRVALLTVAAIALTIAYADQVCATWIRPAVERMRPSNLNNPISPYVHILNGKRSGAYGFPSCHAANSFALAFLVMFLFRRRALTLFLLFWAALNSYSRIYLGVHYPGDLLAGAVVGLSGAAIVYALYRWLLSLPAVRRVLEVGEGETLFGEVRGYRSTLYVGGATILALLLYSLFVFRA